MSEELSVSRLSVLAPGLGAQGASFDVVSQCRTLISEMTFPISRGLFASGNIEESFILENYKAFLHFF
ncbi:MAG: hypothetical protein K2X39_08625 [Silvanigrellaceae bacterium]|nr:hypothetical protein [Silvanigrellaceae bacterium]